MAGELTVPSSDLFYNGVDYAQLSVRELQEESLQCSQAFQTSLLRAMDREQSVEAFMSDREQLAAKGKVIGAAYQRALDRVLG